MNQRRAAELSVGSGVGGDERERQLTFLSIEKVEEGLIELFIIFLFICLITYYQLLILVL